MTRAAGGHPRRRAAIGALCLAVTITACASPVHQATSQLSGRAPASASASATTAVAPGVVPWVDAPPRPWTPVLPRPVTLRYPQGLRACTARDLAVDDPGLTQFTQSDGVTVAVVNVSTSACGLQGWPTSLTATSSDGSSASYRLVRGPALGQPPYVDFAVLRPRGSSFLEVDSSRACVDGGPAPRVHHYSSFTIGLPNRGGAVHFQLPRGMTSMLACGTPQAAPFMTLLPPPVTTGTDAALTIHLDVQHGPVAGERFTFVVTLTNASSRPVSLRSCPSYEEFLRSSGTSGVARTYQLNCGATAGAVPANGSIRFAMQLPLGGVVAGAGKLGWGLLTADIAASASTAIPVTVAAH